MNGMRPWRSRCLRSRTNRFPTIFWGSCGAPWPPNQRIVSARLQTSRRSSTSCSTAAPTARPPSTWHCSWTVCSAQRSRPRKRPAISRRRWTWSRTSNPSPSPRWWKKLRACQRRRASARRCSAPSPWWLWPLSSRWSSCCAVAPSRDRSHRLRRPRRSPPSRRRRTSG